jgi:hypothetical protein
MMSKIANRRAGGGNTADVKMDNLSMDKRRTNKGGEAE